jgi:phosphotransferase system IIB component
MMFPFLKKCTERHFWAKSAVLIAMNSNKPDFMNIKSVNSCITKNKLLFFRILISLRRFKKLTTKLKKRWEKLLEIRSTLKKLMLLKIKKRKKMIKFKFIEMQDYKVYIPLNEWCQSSLNATRIMTARCSPKTTTKQSTSTICQRTTTSPLSRSKTIQTLPLLTHLTRLVTNHPFSKLTFITLIKNSGKMFQATICSLKIYDIRNRMKRKKKKKKKFLCLVGPLLIGRFNLSPITEDQEGHNLWILTSWISLSF